MQLNKVSESRNPKIVFEKDGKFFFVNETWSEAFGPFDDEASAHHGCHLYALTSGLEDREPTPEEIQQWKDLIEMGLDWS